MTKTAFGLDLSGYSGGKSVLARLDRDGGEIRATLLDSYILQSKVSRDEHLSARADAEARLLNACMQLAPLAIDSPIDLQGLPNVIGAEYVWQLTMRAVDYALGALPPLSDRIGAPVARLQNVLHRCGALTPAARNFPPLETYPAASLKLMGLPCKGYKRSTAVFTGTSWVAGEDRLDSEVIKLPVLPDVANGLRLEAAPGTVLSDDDVDAIVCGLAALSSDEDAISDTALSDIIYDALRSKGIENADQLSVPPAGYTLIGTSAFSRITVERRRLQASEILVDGLAA